MNWRRALMMSATAACCAMAIGATTAGPAASAATTTMATRGLPADTPPPTGHLGAAIPVPGLAALNAGGQAEVDIVRCAAPGFCTAVGSYLDGRNKNQAFVVNETSFTWGMATPVPGLAALGNGGPTKVTALSCPAAGDCTLGGWFNDAAGDLQPFVAASAGGVFGSAQPVFTISDQLSQFIARITALSCATPGNCTAALEQPVVPAGGGGPVPQAFLATETSDTWGPLRPVPGIPGDTTTPTGITSVSCWKPGDCLAVGGSGHAGSERPILATQEGGSWSAENTIPGLDGPAVIDFNPDADATAAHVSCWAFTSCTVAGTYGDHHGNQQVFVADWVNGSWATQTIPGTTEINVAGRAEVDALSCGPAGTCALTGLFFTDNPNDSDPNTQTFADSRLAGTWSNAAEIPGIDNLATSAGRAASCPATGGCVIGGYFSPGQDTGAHAYISVANTLAGTKDFGSFGGAEELADNIDAGGNAFVNDISCPFAGECGIGGAFLDGHDVQQGFVADLSSTTATTVTASAATVAAGNEHQVQITATVTPSAGGTPTGTVTVLASGAADQTVCTITLAGGSGACDLPAGSLAPGSYTFTGNYNGDQVYGGSTSAGGSGGGPAFHVLAKPLPTTTRLTLSATRIKAGHEGTEHLTAQVKAASGGAPTGNVTFKAGSTRLCRVPLRHGQARCTLTARQLRPGTYKITARYGGDIAHAPAISPKQTLTVTK